MAGSTIKSALLAQGAIILANYVFTYISLVLQKPTFEPLKRAVAHNMNENRTELGARMGAASEVSEAGDGSGGSGASTEGEGTGTGGGRGPKDDGGNGSKDSGRLSLTASAAAGTSGEEKPALQNSSEEQHVNAQKHSKVMKSRGNITSAKYASEKSLFPKSHLSLNSKPPFSLF